MRPVSPCTGTLPTGRELSVPNVFAAQKSALGHLGLKYGIVPVSPPKERFLERYNPTGGDSPQSNDLPQ
ncbi:hypothetical protein [Rhizobacter sp. P5_C2]